MMTSSNGNIKAPRHWPLWSFVELVERHWPVNSPHKWPVTRSFDVFFDLRLNKRLGKQSWRWWFETLFHPLWRHRNDACWYHSQGTWPFYHHRWYTNYGDGGIWVHFRSAVNGHHIPWVYVEQNTVFQISGFITPKNRAKLSYICLWSNKCPYQLKKGYVCNSRECLIYIWMQYGNLL